MTDLRGAWLRHQLRAGAAALELRHAGHRWREIADELHLGTETDARRAAALALSADLASRLTAAEGAGDAQAGAGTSAGSEPQRVAAALG